MKLLVIKYRTFVYKENDNISSGYEKNRDQYIYLVICEAHAISLSLVISDLHCLYQVAHNMSVFQSN